MACSGSGHRPHETMGSDEAKARFARWLAALAERHLAHLTLRAVARAIRALSSLYVERRARLSRGAVFDGAGKRAAFAVYYGPLHFLMTRAAVRALDAARPSPALILDLGCGTGPAGAAWALECPEPPRVTGFDRHPWAVAEANWTYRTLGLDGRARRVDIGRARLGPATDAIVVAFVANELGEEARERLLHRLLAAHRRGSRILVLEPIARRLLSWWDQWREVFVAMGGRADAWNLQLDLPPLIEQLDRAAGLDHRRVKVRTLWLPGLAQSAGRVLGRAEARASVQQV